ncbi:hypothetical protein L3N51_01654 [Metallosphaera sp. J1]|uniref:hypothetical protein n=1 Tax=Metallosphaera javensis (ex Hofmann et al. 2022) TaxID=99938 RepID=UPI001EDE6CB0|nr:hypothetical protein [Metallosphaera javensis (ex Hofmann et al. 2022)]MCG3109364.1 hypothetical protein [Metallosphaera javensis (ex Hofmann et al. 2022)]
MRVEEILDCGAVKCMRTGEVCVEVDRVRVVYSVNVNPGILMEITLKGNNYSSTCRIIYDMRLDKVVDISCVGFKEERVKITLEECFKRKGILYAR